MKQISQSFISNLHIIEITSEAESEELNISEQSKMDKLLGVFIDRDLYKNPAFCLYLLVALADLAATLSLFIPFQYLPAVAHAHGVDKAHAAYIISATGISSMSSGPAFFPTLYQRLEERKERNAGQS